VVTHYCWLQLSCLAVVNIEMDTKYVRFDGMGIPEVNLGGIDSITIESTKSMSSASLCCNLCLKSFNVLINMTIKFFAYVEIAVGIILYGPFHVLLVVFNRYGVLEFLNFLCLPISCYLIYEGIATSANGGYCDVVTNRVTIAVSMLGIISTITVFFTLGIFNGCLPKVDLAQFSSAKSKLSVIYP
jgi:hypothetical protein